MEAIKVLLAVALGLMMDWVSFERLAQVLGAVGAPREDHAYRDLLFPRVIVTVISSAVIAIGVLSDPERLPLVIVGTAAFMGTTLYGVISFLRGGLGR